MAPHNRDSLQDNVLDTRHQDNATERLSTQSETEDFSSPVKMDNFERTQVDMSACDEEQVRLMEEMCIQVDENDLQLGGVSKKDCHQAVNIAKGLLHRAFSVFVFDSQNRLLLQQRASEKITFPDCFTNTCCSHPLMTPEETQEKNQLGVRLAARRKLEHELGIPPHQVPLDKLIYLTRIHYLAPSDTVWAEHEIDYIFILRADVTCEVNPNEVQSIRFVSKEELQDLIRNAGNTNTLITPWFKLIVERFLYQWWDNLDNLEKHADTETIHRLL